MRVLNAFGKKKEDTRKEEEMEVHVLMGTEDAFGRNPKNAGEQKQNGGETTAAG